MIKIETKYELQYWITRLKYAESLLESIGTTLNMAHHYSDNIRYADDMLIQLRLRAIPTLLSNNMRHEE